jgi:hypothetical protein
MDRVELIHQGLAAVDDAATTYVEIGLRFGTTFREVRATTKIGVDPELMSRKHRLAARASGLRSTLGASTGAFIFSMTSDEFFASQEGLLSRRPPNVVFIDGLHTAEQSHRDTTNALDRLHPRGVIVLHDCNPRSDAAAAATLDEARQHPRYQGPWNGEVWRTVVRLRSERSDLRVCVLDCDEGLGLVAPGAPDSRLDLSNRAVDELSYADLCMDRGRLLNLRPPSYASDFLTAALAE